MNELPKKILVDMDLTIVPWEEHVEALLQSILSAEVLAKRNHTEYFYQKQFGEEHYHKISELFRSEGFFLNLPGPMDGAAEAIREMQSEGIDVIICSKPLPDSEYCIPEKKLWLEKYLGKEFAESAIFVDDKSEAHGDILIDDRLDLLDDAKNEVVWTQVVFDAYHNRHVEVPHRLKHWKDWREVITKAYKKSAE